MSVGAKIAQLAEEAPTVHPGVYAQAYRDYDYVSPEHLRQIYGDVWRAFDPEYPMAPKLLAYFRPREHGKSESSVDCTAWAITDDPTRRVLYLSESSTLASDKLGQISRIVEDAGVEIETNNDTELKLTHSANHGEPTVRAAGFGSKITGGHFDMIVFDDLVDWPSQRTEARRNKIEKQFENYLNLRSEGETVVLMIGTRKHHDDLYSNIIDNPAWKSDVRSAIGDWSIVEDNDYNLVTVHEDDLDDVRIYAATEQAEIPDNRVIVDAEPHREVDVLWPERWPLEKLLVDIHSGFGADEGSLVWKRENQNDATALQGQILGEEMLTWVPELPDGALRWSAGVDLGVEEDPEKAASNDTDYWGFAPMAHDTDRGYLLPPERKRGMSMKRGLEWIEEQMDRRDNLGKARVESNQAQRWIIQEGRDQGIHLMPSDSSGSKEERILSLSARFESGKIVLVDPDDDRWTRFVNEWAEFPSADHDDMLDAAEIAARGSSGSGGISQSDHGLGSVFK